MLWYKEPWVWFIISVPGSAVIVGMIMLYLAIASNDGLVVDDYYKRGLAVNQTLERDQQAAQYQLTGLLRLKPQHLELQLQSVNYTLPKTIMVKLIHATRAGFDQHYTLKQITPGYYETTLSTKMALGNWNIVVEADNWRLIDRFNIPNNQQIQLRPKI